MITLLNPILKEPSNEIRVARAKNQRTENPRRTEVTRVREYEKSRTEIKSRVTSVSGTEL